MPNGFMYLTAVIDWYSRYVLSWKLSNTLDVEFCLEALEEALSRGCPEVFNTDQGVQFTSASFTGRLESAGAQVSMDGRGRCLDNVFVERLWRTVKYEYVYLWRPEAVPALVAGLTTTSATTTRRGPISRWRIERRPRCTGRDRGRRKGSRGCVLGGMAQVSDGAEEEAPDRWTDRGPDAIGVPSAELSLGWMLASRANLRFTRRAGDTARWRAEARATKSCRSGRSGKSVAKEWPFFVQRMGSTSVSYGGILNDMMSVLNAGRPKLTIRTLPSSTWKCFILIMRP